MLYTSLLVAASAFVTSVTAQIQINPGTVPQAERNGWCDAQRNTCPVICQNGTTANTCDPNTLQYNCLCVSGATPNISDYSQTLPFFICQTSIAQCVAATTDASVQARCRDVTCGSRNASAETATTSSAAPSSTSVSSQTSSAASSPTGSAASASSSAPAATGAASALAAARDYGTPALMAGMLAIFGFAM
ncbi:hypothetical protein BDZ85DRAFT_264794 [Elsinoe ampelina]|uniref:DUF7707 domain-containing protein n=1 Tax=Elsinoe ampelina TaxID=302913 RepID=A0A6A6G8G4_9PEZI|nr:hypothetical protein BDZ85DRAFT_264794 [Elsinoe ampelina]